MNMADGALVIAEQRNPENNTALVMAAKLLAHEVRRLRKELDDERRLCDAEMDDGK